MGRWPIDPVVFAGQRDNPGRLLICRLSFGLRSEPWGRPQNDLLKGLATTP